MSYQSPISIDKNDSVFIHQPIKLHGKNYGAIYDASAKIFIIKDAVYFYINDNKYKWIEYHFHLPAEHIINSDNYEAEIHYVFKKCDDYTDTNFFSPFDVCSCTEDTKDILVIGKVITNSDVPVDLTTIQVKLPTRYFEYDGTLTTGTYSPVRWLIGDCPERFLINNIIPVAKTERPIQPFDNRIVLYCHNCKL